MSWTKEQLVREAFAELALAGYVFELTPEELQTGLQRLDTMMATWDGKGITLGYPLAMTPTDSDLQQDSNLPLWAVEAVYQNLAVRLAAGFGKTLKASTLQTARQAYDAVIAKMIEEQKVPVQLRGGLPLGAGNWRARWGYGWGGTFTPDPAYPTPGVPE